MSRKVIQPSKKPNIWFAQIDYDNTKGYNRVVFLPKQVVPIFDEGTSAPSLTDFVLADSDQFVNCNRERRNNFTDSTIVYTRSAYQSYGKGDMLNGKPVIRLTDSIDFHSVNDSEEPIQNAYKEFVRGEVPVVKDGSEKNTTVKPKLKQKATTKKSPIDKLLANYPVPSIADDGYYVDEYVWTQMLFWTKHERENLLLTGPSGTGKTEIATYYGEKVGKSVKTHDMSSMQDPISGMLGVHRLNKEGVSDFDIAPFARDITTDSLILLDEITRAPQEANNLLFPCLDNRRVLPMAYASSELSENVAVNEDSWFFATANEGFDYTGTNVADRALRERFKVIEVDYLPVDIEREVLTTRTGVSKSEALRIATLATSIRSLEKDGDISRGVSMRHSLRVAKMAKGGFDLKMAIKDVFLSNYTSEGDKNTVKEVLSAS